MKAGFHTADITPPLGMERPGDFFKQYIERIHDPLKVRAAVFEDDGTIIAIVGVDTCEFSLPSRLVDTVRRAVTQRTGIPGDHIMLGASHTHSGGPLAGPVPAMFDDAPPFVRTLVTEHSITPDPAYEHWVTQQVISAISVAHEAREEATLSVGSGVEDQVLFNRRFRMRNGRVYTHPGKGNPDIVEPAGPVDPMVGVIAAWRADGTLLGCIVNYGCHCTTFVDGISADYVYYLERTIQGVMGDQAVVVFLQGASGDVTQVDNRSMRENEFGERWSRHVGMRVGGEVVKVLATAVPGDVSPLAAATTRLRIRRRLPSPQRVAASREIVEAGLTSGERDARWIFAKEIVILDYIGSVEAVADVEVQALQIGPAVLLANPTEFFAESGLAIKQGSPFPLTFVVTLANGDSGYVPPASAFEPSGGGYETVLNSYANLEPQAEHQIVQASLDLARDLTPGTLPEHPRIDAPQSAWAYGVLGPERD